MKISLVQKIILIGILIVAANGLLGYSIYKSNHTTDDTHQLLNKSEEVVKHSNLILSRVKDIETSARGYVISKDMVFLEPLNHAKAKMQVSLNKLKFLTVNNPSQRRRVDSLGSYIYKKLDVSLHMIDLRNKEGLNTAIHYVSSRIGKNYTDSIRNITNSINEEERFVQQKQLASYEHDEAVNNRLALTLFLLMSFFTILLLIVAVNYLFQNKLKILRASELIIANKELVFQNEEKGKRAEELLIANMELIDAKVYLKRYIKGLEEMITMTSHKVRLPIANILGLAEMLQESINAPIELKQIIIYIKESALKLDVFTKELTVYMVNLNQKKK